MVGRAPVQAPAGLLGVLEQFRAWRRVTRCSRHIMHMQLPRADPRSDRSRFAGRKSNFTFE